MTTLWLKCPTCGGEVVRVPKLALNGQVIDGRVEYRAISTASPPVTGTAGAELRPEDVLHDATIGDFWQTGSGRDYDGYWVVCNRGGRGCGHLHYLDPEVLRPVVVAAMKRHESRVVAKVGRADGSTPPGRPDVPPPRATPRTTRRRR